MTMLDGSTFKAPELDAAAEDAGAAADDAGAAADDAGAAAEDAGAAADDELDEAPVDELQAAKSRPTTPTSATGWISFFT
jgi:hypothetical protein